MASFAISSHFGALLASVGLEVSGLENPAPNDESRRVCRVVLPCKGKEAKRLFNRLFHAAYKWEHDGLCDCCGYYYRREVGVARTDLRKVLGEDTDPPTVRDPVALSVQLA
jgi:hypothetical protein